MNNILESVLREIGGIQKYKKQLLIAIDGRCGAGKSTLAACLKENLKCNVIHIDHFFLRPEQRTAERINEAGGNVDYERFFSEVISPIKIGIPFSYRPYDCVTQKTGAPIEIKLCNINIIEGAYSCHPTLIEQYDLKIFLSVDKDEQLRRIEKRNGVDGSTVFREKWIPLEELYFSIFRIEEKCELSFR